MKNPIVLAGLCLAFSGVNSLYASAASVSLQCWSDEAGKAGAPSDFDIVERSDGAVTLQVRPSYTLWPGACLREVLVSGIKSESPDGESLTYSFKPILLHHVLARRRRRRGRLHKLLRVEQSARTGNGWLHFLLPYR